jgi:hypothetical protein
MLKKSIVARSQIGLQRWKILNNVVHISGFRGEDGRIVELNVVSLVNTVFNYG